MLFPRGPAVEPICGERPAPRLDGRVGWTFAPSAVPRRGRFADTPTPLIGRELTAATHRRTGRDATFRSNSPAGIQYRPTPQIDGPPLPRGVPVRAAFKVSGGGAGGDAAPHDFGFTCIASNIDEVEVAEHSPATVAPRSRGSWGLAGAGSLGARGVPGGSPATKTTGPGRGVGTAPRGSNSPSSSSWVEKRDLVGVEPVREHGDRDGSGGWMSSPCYLRDAERIGRPSCAEVRKSDRPCSVCALDGRCCV